MTYKADFDMWLRSGDRRVVDEEGARLLELVREKRSISEAAKVMGRSYRHAWGMLREMESSLDLKLVVSLRGGASKGESRLTEHGNKILEIYQNQNKRFKEQLERMYRNPTMTADGMVVSGNKVLLIRRGNEPGKGMLALPGGFVEYGETTQDCVRREVMEETGLVTIVVDLIGVYSDPGRDPRGHLVSVTYLLHQVGGELCSGDDAKDAAFFDLDGLPELAFDHRVMIDDYLRKKNYRSPPCPVEKAH